MDSKSPLNLTLCVKINNPWWTVSLHWIDPMCAQVREYLRDWHRCAACKGSRKQDQLEEALNLSPGIMNLHCFTEGIWGSTSEGPCQDHGAPKLGLDVAVQPRSWNHQHKVCCVCAQSLSCVRLFATPWTVAHQAPLSKGKLQARILEWVSMPSSRGSSQPLDWTQVSRIAGRFFSAWATREC